MIIGIKFQETFQHLHVPLIHMDYFYIDRQNFHKLVLRSGLDPNPDLVLCNLTRPKEICRDVAICFFK
jgi:hypothetical protein